MRLLVLFLSSLLALPAIAFCASLTANDEDAAVAQPAYFFHSHTTAKRLQLSLGTMPSPPARRGGESYLSGLSGPAIGAAETSLVGIVQESKKPGKPELVFRKVNPTRYKVVVSATNSFHLVFNDNFHKGWKAYVKVTAQGRKMTRAGLRKGVERREKAEGSAVLSAILNERGVELTKHYIANTYANGWYVPLDSRSKKPQTLEMVIEFYPQRFFEIGAAISLATLLLLSAYLLHRLLRGKRVLEVG